MGAYRTWVLTKLAPPPFVGAWGAKLLGALADRVDSLATDAKSAAKQIDPSGCFSDALPYVGRTRFIERYFADTDTTYRARLGSAWSVWDAAGESAGIVARLQDQGFSAITLKPWRAYTTGAPSPYEAWWSAFWVWIDSHPFTTGAVWGAVGLTWGDTVPGHSGAPSGPRTWGSDATSYEVAAVRASIRKWRPAAEICAAIVFHDPVAWYWGRTGVVWGAVGLKWGGSNTFSWSGE